jgi:HD-like signal output (HDOD) protein
MTATSLNAGDCTFNQLTTLQLPSMPAGAPYLLKSLTDEAIDFTELASVVEKFPGIAGKLISLVNSAWSAPTAEVTSLEATCSRLGLGVVRSTSIAIAVAAPFNPMRCPAFDLEYYWCSVLLTADAASRLVPLSSSRHEFEPATARAAGLLHNLGLLWLVDRLPGEVDQALAMVKSNEAESIRQALTKVLGIDQAQAGGYLGNNWALPEPLVSTMAHYPEIDYRGPNFELVATVGLAARMVAALLKEEPCPEQDTRMSVLGITQEKVNTVFEQLSGQLAKTRDIAKVLI